MTETFFSDLGLEKREMGSIFFFQRRKKEVFVFFLSLVIATASRMRRPRYGKRRTHCFDDEREESYHRCEKRMMDTKETRKGKT